MVAARRYRIRHVLHLRTFGTLELRGSGGGVDGALLAQPRSVALLVYLLLARPRGFLQRDTLCVLFWPEADNDHARGALSQALSRIRRAAGRSVLQPHGRAELRVTPGAVDCDVVAFEQAVAAGVHARALALYTGPFLAGFHVHNAPEFEAWVDGERDRLRRMAAQSARLLAHEHVLAGRAAAGADAAARALALVPESEEWAAELVEAVAAAGDRTAALSLYDAWATRLRDELELEPSEALQALALELRTVAAAPNAASDVALAPPANAARDVALAPPANAASDVALAPSANVASDVALTTPGNPPERAEAARRWWHRPSLATAGGMSLLLGSSMLVQTGFLSAGFPVEASGHAGAPLGGREWLVAADFDSPSVDPGLALAFQTLLVRDVESAGYTTVVGGIGGLSRRGLEDVLARMRLPPGTPITPDLACEIAEREGAAGVLAGRVMPLGREYVLQASVLSARDCGELIRASTTASFEQLPRAVTAVSRELRTRLGESRSSIRRSPPLPPITAAYVEALRAVERYISDARQWSSPAGAATLEEALRVDPDFAFAHFLLALHHERLGRFELAVPHLVRAYELRAQLPRTGRLGMQAIISATLRPTCAARWPAWR